MEETQGAEKTEAVVDAEPIEAVQKKVVKKSKKIKKATNSVAIYTTDW